MNKIQIKNILISMRTEENEEIINKLLGKIDMMNDVSFESAVKQIGETEELIRQFFENKINKKQKTNSEKHKPINKMFSYGISDNCIHLHLPIDLHQLLADRGFSKTLDTVNLYLLDAIEKIKLLKNDGYYKFQGKDTLYMISPILIKRELKFLEDLDFETKTYRKKELKNEQFIKENPDAMLAVNIFGKDANIGTAKIEFETIQSDEWQEKRKAKVKKFASRGICLKENNNLEK